MNFIALQNSYDDVQIGLFKETANQPLLIERQSITKIQASKLLIPLIDAFFKSHKLTLSTIPFIAVNQGPGPFTTLRVVITTVNGLSYASGIPLIGINALHAIAHEWKGDGITVILCNGFAQDAYYLIFDNGKPLEMGCKNIERLMDELEKLKAPVTLIGNGVDLYRAIITERLGSTIVIPEHYPRYSSLEAIATLGYQSWQSNPSGSKQLMPIYLKEQLYQKSPLL